LFEDCAFGNSEYCEIPCGLSGIAFGANPPGVVVVVVDPHGKLPEYFGLPMSL
jgi:hypothetical protein